MADGGVGGRGSRWRLAVHRMTRIPAAHARRPGAACWRSLDGSGLPPTP
jgi:hypothetical protein